MAGIRSFKELEVYVRSIAAAREVYLLTQKFPKDERYSLTDQVRRSSRAVGALIAEAWARRRYEAAFVNKMNEALGEAMETQAWLDHALACGYIDRATRDEFDGEWQKIGAKLQRTIDRSASFCGGAQK